MYLRLGGLPSDVCIVVGIFLPERILLSNLEAVTRKLSGLRPRTDFDHARHMFFRQSM